MQDEPACVSSRAGPSRGNRVVITESDGAGHLCNRRTVAPLSQCTTTIVCDNRIRGLGYESLYVYK